MTRRATVRIRFEADEPTAVVELSVHGEAAGLAPALAAVVDHVFRWHDCVRLVTFVAEDDRPAQDAWEAAGLRAVAADGADLVYYRRRMPDVSPSAPS